MLKIPVSIAPVMALLLTWPVIYQTVHKINHLEPAPGVSASCHHHCQPSHEKDDTIQVIKQATNCFVCDFKFGLYQDLELKRPGNSLNLPPEKVISVDNTFYHITAGLHFQLRAPPRDTL